LVAALDEKISEAIEKCTYVGKTDTDRPLLTDRD
jgi:hypothetical protein